MKKTKLERNKLAREEMNIRKKINIKILIQILYKIFYLSIYILFKLYQHLK